MGVASTLLLGACGTQKTTTDKPVVKTTDSSKENKTVDSNSTSNATTNNQNDEKTKESNSVSQSNTTVTKSSNLPAMDDPTARAVLISFLNDEEKAKDVENDPSLLKYTDKNNNAFNFILTDGAGNQIGDMLYSVKKDYSEVIVYNGNDGTVLESYKVPENEKKYGSKSWVYVDKADNVTYDVVLHFTTETKGYMDYLVTRTQSGSILDVFNRAPFTLDGTYAVELNRLVQLQMEGSVG